HQSRKKSTDRTAGVITVESWARQCEGHLALVFGIGLLQIGANGVQVGSGLRRSNSGFEMSKRFPNPVVSARVQKIRAGYLLLVHQGHKEVRRAKQQGAVKSERRYANDGEGMFIQLNHAAGNAGIIVKMGVPKGVVEDDIGCAVGATLVGGVEKTAQIRVKAKHIEIVPCNFVEPNAVWIITCVESCLINVITCQIVKTVIAVAEIEIVGVGIVPQLITGPLDSVKALRLRHIQRAQDHC